LAQETEEQFPELKTRRKELMFLLNSQFIEEGTNNPWPLSPASSFLKLSPLKQAEPPVQQDSNQLSRRSAEDAEARSELERISAMGNYREWRKLTMTRRTANKAKNLEELVLSPQ